MKRHVIICTLLAMLLTAVVVSAQPTTQPATKAPTTKVAPATKAPATPAAPVTEPKVEEKVEPAAKAETKEETKTEETSEDTQAWWQSLLVTLLTAFATAATPILSILLMSLFRKWKMKIEQDKVDWALEKGLGWGEQKMKVLLKEGKPVEGSEIAKGAADISRKILTEYGLAKKFGDWIGDLLEAKLGQKVIEAGGAKAVVNGTGGSEGAGS